MQTYSFDFKEKIPDKEVQKIILITKSGNSYNGVLSKNIEKTNNFSLLNILIFGSLLLYVPFIVRIGIFWNNMDNIFFVAISNIMKILPIPENSTTEIIFGLIFLSIIIASSCLITSVIFFHVLFYYHLKIIFRCCEWANKNFYI